MTARAVFPFCAIVGQDALKSALLIAAVDPGIGGVLATGDRGTGKSTAVRALAAVLPDMAVVEHCRFACDPGAPGSWCDECRARSADGPLASVRRAVPMVDLPLGATEDRVVGALDLERALTRGERALQPGLLARANRGFLYVDEVNLLEDFLVDLLIDVAASGENIIEREGLSLRHPARFVLVGSGNPEEGELRPQLLDRFGLSVDVRTPETVAERVEIVRARDAFDRDAAAFVETWADRQAALRARIVAARKMLRGAEAPDAVLEMAAKLCIALQTDGLRGELTLVRAARAAAALDGRDAIESADLRRVAPMALRHRLRRNPIDDGGSDARVARVIDELLPA